MVEAAPLGGTPLYRRVLGPQFERLPAPVRALHDLDRPSTAAGLCDIERGTGLIARWLGALTNLPPEARGLAVTVSFDPKDGMEIWRRDFAGRGCFRTVQQACRSPGDIVERYGPLAFRLAVLPDAAGLDLRLCGVRIVGLPVPRLLWPKVAAREEAAGGDFVFDVRVALPWGALLIHYRGRLRPVA